MINNLILMTTFLSALGSGLVAGIFFAFSAFIMTALSRLPAQQGAAAMKSINAVILNPLFGVVFVGTAAASLGLAVASLLGWGEEGTNYLLAGSLLYLVSFLVTMVFNVPLNNALAVVEPNHAHETGLWTRYLGSWTAWNHVRTVTSLAALASFILAFR